MRRRAAANGDVPFVTVPINVRGEAVELPLYVGMEVAKEVAKFGETHQVGKKRARRVATSSLRLTRP